MAYPGKITDSDLELMAALRAEGLTYQEIGEKFEVTQSAVHKALKAIGAHRIEGPFGPRLNSIVKRIERDERRTIAQALADYAARRYSLSFTAKLLGLHWSSLQRIAKHYGIKFETRRGKTAGYDEMNVMPMVKAAKLKRLAEKGITHNGVTRSAQEWSLMLGGSPGLVRQRLRHGWPIKDAVTRPPMRRGHKDRKTHSNYKSKHNHPWRKDSWGKAA